MSSTDTNALTVRFFQTLAEGESQIEAIRKSLNSCPDFDPFLLFNRLDQYRRNYLTEDNLIEFAKLHQIDATINQGKFLILFYDADSSRSLSYNEFLNFVLSKDFYQTRHNTDFNSQTQGENYISYETEKHFAELLQREFDLIKTIDSILADIKSYGDFSVSDLLVKLGSNGVVTAGQFENYFKSNNSKISKEDIGSLMRRVDLKRNGKVDMSDLEKVFYFPYSSPPSNAVSRSPSVHQVKEDTQSNKNSQFGSPISNNVHASQTPLAGPSGSSHDIPEVLPNAQTTQSFGKNKIPFEHDDNNIGFQTTKETFGQTKLPRNYGTSNTAGPSTFNAPQQFNNYQNNRFQYQKFPKYQYQFDSYPKPQTEFNYDYNQPSSSYIPPYQEKQNIYDSNIRNIGKNENLSRNARTNNFAPSYTQPQIGNQLSPLRISKTLALRVSPTRKTSPGRLVSGSGIQDSIPNMAPIQPPENVFTEGQFLGFLSLLMDIESEIEKHKIEILCKKPDFNIEDVFVLFETPSTKNDLLTFADFKQGFQKLGLNFSDEDIQLLIERFDLVKEGGISYSNLFDMLVPFDKENRDNVERRPSSSLSQATINDLKQFFNYLLDVERKIDAYRQKISSAKGFDLKRIYDEQIDQYGRGFNSDEDVESYLRRKNIQFEQREADLLFIRLDRNRDGKVTFNDFALETTPFSR